VEETARSDSAAGDIVCAASLLAMISSGSLRVSTQQMLMLNISSVRAEGGTLHQENRELSLPCLVLYRTSTLLHWKADSLFSLA